MSRLPRRRVVGSGVVMAGVATIAAALALTRPATPVSAATFSGSYLIVTVSATPAYPTEGGTFGKYPKGSTATVTFTVSNSNTTIVNGTNTTTIDAATPGADFFFPTANLKELANSGGFTCAAFTNGAFTNSGDFTCSDGTIAVGGAKTQTVEFSVIGPVGRNAGVEVAASETGSQNQFNSNTFQQDVTQPATIENPASYDKADAQSSAFTAKVGGTDQILFGTTSTSFNFTDGANTITLHIPAGAFTDFGLRPVMHISVYKANASWSSSFSARHQGFINGYGVAWTTSGSGGLTTGPAAGTITMIVSNPAISSTDSLYRATTTGIGTQTSGVGNGAYTVTFTEDPGFVLAQAAVIPPPTTSSTSPTTTITAPAGGGGGATGTHGGGAALPIGAGVLLVITGTVIAGTGRRRALAPTSAEA